MSLNNDVRIMGFCADVPKFRHTQKGTAMATLVVYTQDYEADNTPINQAHRCVLFGAKAEKIVALVEKGRHIHIRGSLRTKRIEKEGDVRYYTSILVDEYRLSPRQSVAAVKDLVAQIIDKNNVTNTKELGLFQEKSQCGK